MSAEDRSLARGDILIVDDHALTRTALSLAVRRVRADASILHASSIADAAPLLGSGSTIELILLDYVLPDAHGFGGLSAMRQVAPDARIVIVSAAGGAAFVALARTLGAVGFVQKTQPLDTIAAALGRILNGGEHFDGETPPVRDDRPGTFF
jgi:DNA-binding NarL/FixJ family response regulator